MEKNLIFFDKEGNSLNFGYNTDLERYEGDILFHENSSDTFKTQAIYLLEKKEAFDFEDPNSLQLRRFQLFNEYGFHFYASTFVTQSIVRIEPTNQESNYYSKWIYGQDFDSKFPLGTIIKFDQPIFEFTNPDLVYTVVSAKDDAILIISSLDNNAFTSLYSGSYSLTASYVNKTISSVDIIGIYDYIYPPTLSENLSSWNEFDFYDRIYQGRKLSIVNTSNNDSMSNVFDYENCNLVTVLNPDIPDITHFEYQSTYTSLPNNSPLIIEVKTKTDLPLVYQGPLTFTVDNKLQFSGPVSSILKPGVEFKVVNSVLNSNFLTVDSIPTFLGNVNLINYVVGNQVLWNNKIYECVQAYTWTGTSSITPDNTSYWIPTTFLPIENALTPEVLLTGDLYLTTDHFYFTQAFTASSEVTFASAAQRYVNELRFFNVDLYFDSPKLKADLVYPSDYVEVTFHRDLVTSTSSISSRIQKLERSINVEEKLVKEFNYDFSTNFSYNIVFTDIDEFGILFKINKDLYEQEVIWIYSSGVVDMQRTIDKTLRTWLTKYSNKLLSIGILPSLSTIGYTSVYYNSIILRTEYPNIQLNFEVEVGDTADFYIEHTNVIFYDMSNYLSIRVNNRTYAEFFDTSIPITLSNWIDTHAEILEDFGIYVVNVANVLKFRVKSQIQRVVLDISVGKTALPGIDLFRVEKKLVGNHGALITSNEAVLATASNSFEAVGFATGMVVSVNETIYPLQNIEYNVVFLDPDRINFEYEGPFWGTTGSICSTSPYTIVALDSGFEAGVCPPIFIPVAGAGMFDPLAFTASFSINYLTTSTYSLSVYALSTLVSGIGNLSDLIYVQPVNSIYVLGDQLVAFDSVSSNIVSVLSLGITNSISLKFNQYTNYLYALSTNILFEIDPYINIITASYSFTQSAYDIETNPSNGDVYVSFQDSNFLRVYGTSITNISTPAPTLDLVFNEFESDLYVVSGDEAQVLRIDGSTLTIQATYSIPGVTYSNSIIYEPVNESIYVFGSASLFKIDGGSVTTISVSASNFNDLVFNNIEDGISISRNSNHSLLNLSNDTLNYELSSFLYYGYQAINQYDEDIYMTSQNTTEVIVIDSETGFVMTTLPIGATATRIIYNQDRRTMWTIQPSTQNVLEISVGLNGVALTSLIEQVTDTENMFGTLDPEYSPRGYLWLFAREYLRRPRENFNGEPVVSLYWRWFSDNVPEFFFYDFSGNQLTTTGPLAYTGIKPLPTVYLNRSANRNPAFISKPEYQQTIFDSIEISLDYIDDEDDVSIVPEPFETFIGFNSPNEGPIRTILQLYKKEDIDFTITTSNSNNNVITFETITTLNDRYGRITLDANSSTLFSVEDDGSVRGLEPGQHLAIFISDATNTKRQYLSENNGYLVKIRSVYFREIIVDFFKDVDEFLPETSVISNYPKTGNTTYLSVRFKVWDKEIGRFNVFAQTEIEDERFHIELNNVGKLVSSDDVYIFKDYDIKEEGIDWIYLNQKRKEMLLMKHLIYPYIGSYKSIINAINYFGYNDLELNEYYRNVDISSVNFGKLFKVEIPDIFDNTVEGWTENDFIKNTFPNDTYEETNLFNLTYRITDKEGNNLLTYTLEEVQKKLQGLKYWLQNNIIPITHRILDITGKADFVAQTSITHLSRDSKFVKVNQEMTPVKFRLNEAYLMPVNNGSTVYNCVLDFYLESDFNYPDYFTIDIRTYEIYREWYPFKNYSIGERVIYFDKLYESVTDDNLTNNPRKYENAPQWQFGQIYNVTDIVEFSRDYFVYSGLGGTAATASLIEPPIDTTNWLNITDWKMIDLLPIQKISEYRIMATSSLIYPATSSNWIWPEPIYEEIQMLPYNFVVDSNIDPFIVIEVSCDNGYGLVYRDRKNYDIKGILDIQELEAMHNLTSKQYRDAFIQKTDIKQI